MRRTPQHIYQVLTKRADRRSGGPAGDRGCPTRGTSGGWQCPSKTASTVGHGSTSLRQSTAGIKFLSVEPLLEDLGRVDLRAIDWVIAGGESGWRARPMDAAWVRSVREQCIEQGVPFFFKQWGGAKKSEAGRILDGETWDEYPRLDHPALGEALHHRGLREAEPHLHEAEGRRARGAVPRKSTTLSTVHRRHS